LIVGIPLGSLPIRARLGSAVYGRRPADERFGVSTVLIAEAGAAFTPAVALEDAILRAEVSVAYRHYFSRYEFESTGYRAYRPIVSAGIGAHLVLNTHVTIGPVLVYDVVFDETVRHVLEPGIAVTTSF
jgi:hypothetical protein